MEPGSGDHHGTGRRRPARGRRVRLLLVALVPAAVGVAVYLYVSNDARKAVDGASRGDVEQLRFLLAMRPQLVNADWAGRSPLQAAVAAGHTDAADLLIARGADVNAADSGGLTPLHRAVRDGRVELVRLLLGHGADADAHDPGGARPIFLAVAADQPELIRALLAGGADPDARDGRGDTPVCLAIRAERRQALGALLEGGASPNASCADGQGPVRLAARPDRIDLLADLLDHGGELNQRDDAGRTLLDRDWTEDSLELLRLLVGRGAEGDPAYVAPALAMLIRHGHADDVRQFLRTRVEINEQSRVASAGGATLLHLAALAEHEELVDLLIARGADVNAVDEAGRTVLDAAVADGTARPGVVKSLLRFRAAARVVGVYRAMQTALEGGAADLFVSYLADRRIVNTLRDEQGNGLLHLALLDGNADAAALLVANGADVAARNWQGLYPLHLAVTAPRSADRIVAVLLSGGADPNARDLYEQTPLHAAARAGAPPAVLALLLDGGARVEALCEDRFTALLRAAERADIPNVKLLLARGADPNRQDAKGQTALHYAALSNNLELARVMLDGRAGTRIRDNSRMLARVYASQSGYAELAELILAVEAERAAEAQRRSEQSP